MSALAIATPEDDEREQHEARSRARARAREWWWRYRRNSDRQLEISEQGKRVHRRAAARMHFEVQVRVFALCVAAVAYGAELLANGDAPRARAAEAVQVSVVVARAVIGFQVRD